MEKSTVSALLIHIFSVPIRNYFVSYFESGCNEILKIFCEAEKQYDSYELI